MARILVFVCASCRRRLGESVGGRAVSKHLYFLVKAAAQNGADDFTVIRQIESTNIAITFEFSKALFTLLISSLRDSSPCCCVSARERCV